MPASPGNVVGAPPIATPRRRQLGQAARDHRGPCVVADTEALRHAGGDGDDVLERAADLAADHVVVGVDAEHAGGEHSCSARATVWSSMAMTVRPACPAMISFARFGPVSMPTGWPGSTSLMTSAHPQLGAVLQPLASGSPPAPTGAGGGDRLEGVRKALRRDAHHQHVGLADGLLEVGRGPQPVGKRRALQVARCWCASG